MEPPLLLGGTGVSGDTGQRTAGRRAHVIELEQPLFESPQAPMAQDPHGPG
jgi:hypothetical protein